MRKIAPSVVIIFTFCLIFAAGFFGLVYPSLTPIGAKLTKLNEYRESTLATSATDARSGELAAQRTALEKETKKIDKLLPDETNLYDLSIQIEALTKVTGVTLTSISLTPATEPGIPQTKSVEATTGLQTAPTGTLRSSVSLGVAGGYSNLQQFLDGLTKLERFVEVLDIIVSTNQSGTTMAINAAAYSMGEQTIPKGGSDE